MTAAGTASNGGSSAGSSGGGGATGYSGAGGSAAGLGGSSAGAGTTGGSAAAGSASGGSAGSASGGSAGSGNGGASNGGSGNGGSAASGCPANALFCDDFEAGNFDKWNSVNLSGGSLTVGSKFVTSGTGALFIDTPAGERGGFLELTGSPLFPLPNNVMYGRAMVLFEGGTPDGHTDIVRGADADGNVPFYNLGEQHHEILLNYFVSYPEQDCWARPPGGYELPNDTWMCWEWKFDANTSEIEFYIDGALSRKVSQTGDGCLNGDHVWEAPDFGSLQIGEYIAESGDPSKLWIDDVAVGTQARLGCPAP